jgi:hypothetical protein
MAKNSTKTEKSIDEAGTVTIPVTAQAIMGDLTFSFGEAIGGSGVVVTR